MSMVKLNYRVKVCDGRDSAKFVVFDTEVSKLTKMEAATLALERRFGLYDKETIHIPFSNFDHTSS